jgi:hypothetical protein
MIHLESLVGNAFQANLGKNFQQFSQGWIKGFEMASQNNFRCKFLITQRGINFCILAPKNLGISQGFSEKILFNHDL